MVSLSSPPSSHSGSLRERRSRHAPHDQQHPQRRRQSGPRSAAPAVGAQRRALTDAGAEGIRPPMPSPVFSTRSHTATAAFTQSNHRTPVFLLVADSTHVHPQQPVNTSVFAAADCTLLIPVTFTIGNLKFLHSNHLGVTCQHSTRCRRQRAFDRGRHSSQMEAPDAARPPPKRRPAGSSWLIGTERSFVKHPATPRRLDRDREEKTELLHHFTVHLPIGSCRLPVGPKELFRERNSSFTKTFPRSPRM